MTNQDYNPKESRVSVPLNWACTECGYKIEGNLPDKCPECGAAKKAFDEIPIPGF